MAHLTEYGTHWTRVFDGNDINETGFADTPTITIVDGQGRTVRAMTLDDSESATSALMATTTYDVMGNLLALERGAAELSSAGSVSASFVSGQTTRRELLYDSLGRRTHNLDPDSGTSLYFYDRFGELTRFVDSRGAESRFVYDLGGRLIAEDHGLLFGADGAAWVSPSSDGHSSDDDPGAARLAVLVGQLWDDFQRDTNGDFFPETGADVLYGFDVDYEHDLSLCAGAPTALQSSRLGALSWVRDQSGCTWTSYDRRGRTIWTARQVDPDSRVFLTETSYVGPDGPDDIDRVRAETYPDGTSLHYTFTARGNLAQLTGGAPTSGSLFDNRQFVYVVSYDVHGGREEVVIGHPGENQVITTFERDERRRLTDLVSTLDPSDGSADVNVIDNDYHFDEVGNITTIVDQRALSSRTWSPVSVDYAYFYDPLYRLTNAVPAYASNDRPLDESSTPNIDEERPGEQAWTFDELGSMRSWSSIEEFTGDHFYGWSLGTIINGQQLIQAGATTGTSSRCATDHADTAGARISGPAPHALYFAYQPTDNPGEYEAIEACYDPAGNMVGLYRLELTGCGADPLDEAGADWDCTTETELFTLAMTWDAVGRLVDVVKTDVAGLGAEDAHLQHIYDASNSRIIRLDHETSEGDARATLYVSGGYEIRNATIATGGYIGGEETKFVFDGPNRLARVVEPNSHGLTWPYAPDEGYIAYTLTNHLGSASVTIHANPAAGQGPIIATQTQLPYGSEDDAVDSSDHGGWRPDYEFTGKEQDPDVGLMYFGARFYINRAARWTKVDPLSLHGLSGDLNQYNYVASNPIKCIDPDGLSIFDILRRQEDVRRAKLDTSERSKVMNDEADLMFAFINQQIGTAADLARILNYRQVQDRDGLYFEVERIIDQGEQSYRIQYNDQGTGRAGEFFWTAFDFAQMLISLPSVFRRITRLFTEGDDLASLVHRGTKNRDADLSGLHSSPGDNAMAYRPTSSGRGGGRGGGGGTPRRIFSSPDEHVADIANRIEARYPGHVSGVNVMENGRELDIVLSDGTILQVKSGNARGLNAQLTATQRAFPDRVVIGVHPDRPNRAFQRAIDRTGNLSTSNVDDLVDVVAP